LNSTATPKNVALNTNFIATNLKSDNETRLAKVISDLSNLDTQYAKLDGDQTISGVKNFTDNVLVNSINGYYLISVEDYKNIIVTVKVGGYAEIGRYLRMNYRAGSNQYYSTFTLNSDNVTLDTNFIAPNINPINSILTMYSTENPSTKCGGTWELVGFDGILERQISNHFIRLEMNNRALHCVLNCKNTLYGNVNITYPAGDFGLSTFNNGLTNLPISVFINNTNASGHTVTYNDLSTSMTIDIAYGSATKPNYVATFDAKLKNSTYPGAPATEFQMVYNFMTGNGGMINSTSWRRTA
jgi:hypothetical protein